MVAQPYSERPRRFVYELTAAGRELAGALRLLADWGARHSEAEPVAPRAPAAPRSRRAGTARPATQTVDEPDEEGVHYA